MRYMSRLPSSARKGILQHEKIRFVLVGCINTSVDFGLLFVLVNLILMPAIFANIISTTVALCVSYLLNKKAVFGADATNAKQIVLFVVVTLAGLWILQGGIIALLAPVLQPVAGDSGGLLGAKLIATLFSLTWNYLWYSRVVFRKDGRDKEK